MAHDVFISYSGQDKNVAFGACAKLESQHIRCWIGPRDVPPGSSYGESIIEAIAESRLFVLIFSEGANGSEHVIREVERAVSKGIPILPFRIEEAVPSKALEYFLSSRHWLDAMTPPIDQHLNRLTESVESILSATTHEKNLPCRGNVHEVAADQIVNAPEQSHQKRISYKSWILIFSTLVALIGGAIAATVYSERKEENVANTSETPEVNNDIATNNSTIDQMPSKVIASVESNEESPMSQLFASQADSKNLTRQNFVVAKNDSYSVKQGQSLQVTTNKGVLANDTTLSGTNLSAIMKREPLHGKFTLHSNGAFTYDHDGGNSKVDTFSYEAVDLDGSLASAQVEISIYSPESTNDKKLNTLRAFDYYDGAEKIARSVGEVLPPDASVFVRPFYYLGEMDIGFAKRLGDKLEELGFRIQRGAKTEIQGRFVRKPLQESKAVEAIRIVPEIFFADGTKQQLDSVTLANRTEAQIVFQATGIVAKTLEKGTTTDSDQISTAVLKDKGQRIYPISNSPFSTELLVNGEAVPIEIIDGIPHASLTLGDEYSLKIYNEALFDVATRVRIDGLERFTLADDSRLQKSMWDLVPAKSLDSLLPSSREIKGWYRTENIVNAFVFGAYEDSVLGQQLPLPPSDSGTIVIAFAAAVPEDAKFPAGEPIRDKSIGTGQGGAIHDTTHIVRRKVGAIRAIIRIRYSARNAKD